MDPQETWSEMLDAFEQKQWELAKELADALYEWLEKGGFPPTTIGAKALANGGTLQSHSSSALRSRARCSMSRSDLNSARRTEHRPARKCGALVESLSAPWFLRLNAPVQSAKGTPGTAADS